MSVICQKCGTELPDNAKFCGSCGNNIAAAKRNASDICPNCGSQLKGGAKFCSVCGAKIFAAQEAPAPKAKPEKPTMDELVPPEITDEMFAGQGQTTVRHAGDPDFDSILPPGAEPAENAAAVQPSEEELRAAAQEDSFVAETPSVAETPIINDSYYAGVTDTQPQAGQTAYQESAYQSSSVQNAASAQTYSAANNISSGNTQPLNYGNMPDQQYTAPVQQNVTPGKNPSVLLPIILIVLILAVIAVDIFVLFPDRIFGEKDSAAEKEAAAVFYIDEAEY